MTTYANITEVLNSIKLNVAYLGRGFMDSKTFKCVLKFEGRQMTTRFSKGTSLQGEPTVIEVLEHLVNTTYLLNPIYNLRDFADTFGYDLNTSENFGKTLDTYNGLLSESKNTLRLLGNMERVNSLHNYFNNINVN